ncbi:MAG: MoaD/ThiS family protein [Candidatus Bathyarchaeia archaeon]|nr:MoaD/ThiS family protein [Candidatus Bathyarchaeota archaeon]
MQIKTVYLGLIRSKIGKTGEQHEVAKGSSLSDLFKILTSKYGEKLESVIGEKKENWLDPTVIITVNGVLQDPLKGDTVTLNDGDVVTIMTLISGG